MSTITTRELEERRSSDGLTVLDVRPLAAYNGWRLAGEPRGGHIPGARAFPAVWLRSVDEAEITRILDEKGIVPGRAVVLYGYGSEDVAAVAARLHHLGIEDVRTDKRIDFVGGIRGTAELERLVDEGRAAVAFSLHPTTVDDLMRIADAGEIMPPKSTWFEPKLRDGLLTHLI